MLRLIDLSTSAGPAALESLLSTLRLDVRSLLVGELSETSEKVRAILRDVLEEGVDAIVRITRTFDDPAFDASRIRVTTQEMAEAHAKLLRENPAGIEAMRRAIAQVREYQAHVMPRGNGPLLRASGPLQREGAPPQRAGVSLDLRYTPIDSAGLYVPGGKASYPSSLIMLAVPAQVAGVKRLAVCTPAGKFGDNALLYAAAHELGLDEVYRIGGPAAIGALAAGIPGLLAPVDKVVGPGNTYVQLAKRLVSSAVGVDGFYGPSEIVTLADDSARPAYVAADLLAQAEHDPGRCFLVTDSPALIGRVNDAIAEQLKLLSRREPIERSLREQSAAIVTRSIDEAIEVADRLAAEHVNVQVRDVDRVLRKLRHAGAIFVGPHSPVAAGDYVAGPSHTLPTNTTARFGGGISVYEFLKRTGIVEYTADGLRADAPAIEAMARLEGLDAHAASVRVRED